jgi:hypothetical protein
MSSHTTTQARGNAYCRSAVYSQISTKIHDVLPTIVDNTLSSDSRPFQGDLEARIDGILSSPFLVKPDSQKTGSANRPKVPPVYPLRILAYLSSILHISMSIMLQHGINSGLAWHADCSKMQEIWATFSIELLRTISLPWQRGLCIYCDEV